MQDEPKNYSHCELFWHKKVQSFAIAKGLPLHLKELINPESSHNLDSRGFSSQYAGPFDNDIIGV
jgi:hypothetical protein